MENNTTIITVRRFRAAPFAIAAVCFLLPCIQVSCTMDRNVAFPITGLQMVTGTEVQSPDFGGGDSKTEKIPSSPLAIVVLLCSLGAFGLCFLSSRTASVLAVLAGGLGFIIMLVLKARLDQEIVKQGEGLLLVEYRIGFVAICICLLVGAGVNAYLVRRH